MSWITREFQFSKSQAEREFLNCPLYKSYVRAAKTAKGTKWQRDPRKKLLSKFSLVENPCQPAFLFCNREKAKEFFEKDWAKRKNQKEPAKRRSVSPVREMSLDPHAAGSANLAAGSTRKNFGRETPQDSGIFVRSSNVKSQAPQLSAPSAMSQPSDKTKKIGIFIRGFK